MSKKIKQAISSDSFCYKINEDIIIYEGRFYVYLDKKYRCVGKVYLKMGIPTSINFKGKIIHIKENELTKKLDYYDGIIEIHGYQLASVTIKKIDNFFIKGYINENYIKSKDTSVDYIYFNIINLDKLPGYLIEHKDKMFAGRIEFETTDYEIIIDKRYDYTKELKEILKSKNGFITTHIGRIKRKDNSSFKTKNIIDLLEKISYALSFLCARRIGISIVNGYTNDINTYRLCIKDIIMPYNFLPSWSDTISNHNNIEKYMNLIMKKLEDDYNNLALKRVIDWYIESISNLTIENNIISIQIALETLSYIILVQEEKKLSNDEFDNNTAINNIRMLLESCKLNNNKELMVFDDKIKERFNDGIELIIYLRNKIVHPARKDKIYLSHEDVWNIIQIGTRYIELIILKFIGYKGEYSNRLKDRYFGQVERVPWSD
mgnify:CR=1 FL=1